jgi:hypothetical protein
LYSGASFVLAAVSAFLVAIGEFQGRFNWPELL